MISAYFTPIELPEGLPLLDFPAWTNLVAARVVALREQLPISEELPHILHIYLGKIAAAGGNIQHTASAVLPDVPNSSEFRDDVQRVRQRLMTEGFSAKYITAVINLNFLRKTAAETYERGTPLSEIDPKHLDKAVVFSSQYERETHADVYVYDHRYERAVLRRIRPAQYPPGLLEDVVPLFDPETVLSPPDFFPKVVGDEQTH